MAQRLKGPRSMSDFRSESSAPKGESPEDWEFQSKPGEHYDPRDTGFHVQLLRERFLSLACRYRPEIAEELNGTLYECFQPTRMKARVPDPTRPPLPELQTALEEWQGKWGLQEEWITYWL